MNIIKALFGGTEEPENGKRDDRQFDILKYDGVRAMNAGAMDYALKCFRHALQIHDDLEIHDYLSRVLMAKGELAEAVGELHVLAEAQPNNVEIFVRLARVAYMMEDYDAMTTACEQAEALDADSPLVAFLTAQARRGRGDQIGALAMLTRAITLDESYGDAYLLRGELLLEMGDAVSADKDALWLLERIPDNEDILLLKARIEQRLGRPESAIDYYTRVIGANPFHADAFRERGAVRMAQGDMIGATEDAEHAMELCPDEAASVNGDYSAEGIEQKVRQAYRDNNPFGLG